MGGRDTAHFLFGGEREKKETLYGFSIWRQRFHGYVIAFDRGETPDRFDFVL
jgi:hypothetical protein